MSMSQGPLKINSVDVDLSHPDDQGEECPWPSFSDARLQYANTRGEGMLGTGFQDANVGRSGQKVSNMVTSMPGDGDQDLPKVAEVAYFPDEIVRAAVEVPAASVNAKGDIVPVPAVPWWKVEVNFYRVLVLYLAFLALASAGIMQSLSPNLAYVDCLYLCVSCVCGCGLYTISILDVQAPALGVMYFLFLAGLQVTIQFLVYMYKRHMFTKIKKELRKLVGNRMTEFETGKLEGAQPEEEELLKVIARKSMQQRGEMMAALAMFIHLFFHIFIGSFIFYGIAQNFYSEGNYPDAPDVDRPGVSRLFWAAFLVICAFCQAGLTATADSVIGLADKPGLYMYLTVPILFGNTMAPISFRALLLCMQRFAKFLRLDEEGIEYALRRPRMVSFMLFDNHQTIMLALILLGINLTEWFIFLASTLNSTEAEVLGDHEKITGLGWFATISTRAAGLQIMDFRVVNHGMLVVWAIMMYISSAPLVSRMYVSEQTEQTLKDKGPLRKAVTTRGAAKEVINDFQSNFLFTHVGWLAIAFVTLCFCENDLLVKASEVNIFTIAWELISAYGGVGTSMGYQGLQTASGFTVLGKVMIMLTMGLGKMRGMPITTDIAIDFSFQTITNALRNYAVAVMARNYEQQRCLLVPFALVSLNVVVQGAPSCSVASASARNQPYLTLSSPFRLDSGLPATSGLVPSLQMREVSGLSVASSAVNASRVASPALSTMRSMHHKQSLRSSDIKHVHHLSTDGLTRLPSAGSNSMPTSAAGVVIDPLECPLLYQMVMGSLAETAVASPTRHSSRTGSRVPSIDLAGSADMPRPRPSLDVHHDACQPTPDRSAAGQVPRAFSLSKSQGVASGSMSRQSSGIQMGGSVRATEREGGSHEREGGSHENEDVAPDEDSIRSDIYDAPPSMVRNISTALGDLFTQQSVPLKAALTKIADTALNAISKAILEPSDVETVEEQLKKAQMPVLEVVPAAFQPESQPTSGLSPNLLFQQQSRMSSPMSASMPGPICRASTGLDSSPPTIFKGESTEAPSSSQTTVAYANHGPSKLKRDELCDLPDHLEHFELDPVTEELPEDALWSMEKPFPPQFRKLSKASEDSIPDSPAALSIRESDMEGSLAALSIRESDMELQSLPEQSPLNPSAIEAASETMSMSMLKDVNLKSNPAEVEVSPSTKDECKIQGKMLPTEPAEDSTAELSGVVLTCAAGSISSAEAPQAFT